MTSSFNLTMNDGIPNPILGYGTATALFRKDAKDWVKMAYNDAKLRHIDTAAYYENENTVGEALKELGITREEIFITTKSGMDITPRQSLEKSLKLIDIDYVDLYLIHLPQWVEGLSLSEAWREMEALQAEGKAKSIGVSNYAVLQLEETLKYAKIVPCVNQIEVHPYVFAKVKPIIDYCHRKGIKIACYTSLASITAFPGGPLDAVVQRIASEIGATENQVLMKWAHQVTYGGVIVTTSSKKERLTGQIKALTEMRELTEEQIRGIVKAGAQKHQRVYSQGMEHMDE